MRQRQVLLLPVLVLSGCVSSKTINDLRLEPMSPADPHVITWTEPILQWVLPFSPAGMAGLAPGDRLVSLNGVRCSTVGQASELLNATDRPESIEVAFTRHGTPGSTVVRNLAINRPIGTGVYSDASVYTLRGFPDLPQAVGFLEFGSAMLSVFAARFSDQPEILLLRFQIDNVRSGPMQGPSAVQVADLDGSLLHQLSPEAAVGWLLPSLGSQSPYAPYVPYRPPVYTVSPDGRYLYPQSDPYTAMANSLVAIGNMITAINNGRKVRREQDRETLYRQLSATSLRTNTIPEGGRDAGTLLFKGRGGGPIKVMINIENHWHILPFS
jgi:PDZ domain